MIDWLEQLFDTAEEDKLLLAFDKASPFSGYQEIWQSEGIDDSALDSYWTWNDSVPMSTGVDESVSMVGCMSKIDGDVLVPNAMERKNDIIMMPNHLDKMGQNTLDVERMTEVAMDTCVAKRVQSAEAEFHMIEGVAQTEKNVLEAEWERSLSSFNMLDDDSSMGEVVTFPLFSERVQNTLFLEERIQSLRRANGFMSVDNIVYRDNIEESKMIERQKMNQFGVLPEKDMSDWHMIQGTGLLGSNQSSAMSMGMESLTYPVGQRATAQAVDQIMEREARRYDGGLAFR